MKRLSIVLLLFVVFVAFIFVVLPGRLYAAPTPPPYTTSWYMNTVDSTSVYNMGCTLGTHDLNTAGTQDNVVILMFGKPSKSGTTFGTIIYNQAFASTTQIATAAEQFGKGYYICTGSDTASTVKIVVGTSNYWSGTNHVNYAHGAAWAQMVNSVGAWLQTQGYSSQSTAVGGSDMELSWNTVAATKDWVNGYDSADQYALYDFGDAAGCTSTSSGNQNCNNGWKSEDVWFISWGAPPAYPLPQIYNTLGTQAKQWYRLSRYSFDYHGGRMGIVGALTQWQACQQRGGCSGVDNTPATGWTQLWTQLNNDANTAQSLRWSTDMKWR